MRSPIDTHVQMVPEELAQGLRAWRCPTSKGCWIDGDIYRAWIKRRIADPETDTPAPDTPPSSPTLAPDTHTALLSPRTGRLLTKLVVHADLNFRIDYDTHSGGFWLDRGEFEAIAQRGLARSLHDIAAPAWQRKAQEQERSDARRQQLVDLFGEPNVWRAEQAADWLRETDHQQALAAYILELTER
ncbi:MAG: hypothetical protein ACF8Q5_14415 [Phycisphaerales bacterium JB040]